MDFFQFTVPTKVVFGEGLAKDFSAELDFIPAQKYLIVTDKVLNDLGLIDPIVAGINESGREVVGVFQDVPPDSGVQVVKACAEAAKKKGAEGIIAVGGGSVLDTAKGANILFSLGGDLVDDYSGAQTITQDLAPLIAIPTAAGTGSEVTEAIVILAEDGKSKLAFVDSHLFPKVAILDPELTIKLPAKLTAATALDALTHAIEATMSLQKQPLSDALAHKAIEMIFKNILPAVKDGSNIEARGALLIASTMAGMAFNYAMVGVVHAVAHTVGAMFHLHHGTANGIFLPFGMEFNLEEREEVIADLAPFVGVDENSAHAVIDAVINLRKKLNKECGLPISLSECGIKKTDLPKIAERVPDDGACFYNPVEVTSDGILPYLEKAF